MAHQFTGSGYQEPLVIVTLLITSGLIKNPCPFKSYELSSRPKRFEFGNLMKFEAPKPFGLVLDICQ